MKWIEKSIQSILNSTLKVAIIIVDNNSVDGTISFIEEKYNKDVFLIKSKENLGFGKGNNLGLKKALELGGEYFFLLNQDAFIENNTISNLIYASKRNLDYGILSPIHYVWEKDSLDAAFVSYISYKNNSDFISDFVLGKEKSEIYQVPYVAASGWLIIKKCIETVGGFDPIFFFLGEDVNYCQRVSYHGFKIGIVPNSKFYHDTKKRLEDNPRKKYKNYFDYFNKMKFANVLIEDIEGEIKKINLDFRKKIIKQLIKFQFRKFMETRNSYKQLKKIIEKSLLSRNINKTKGPHYI